MVESHLLTKRSKLSSDSRAKARRVPLRLSHLVPIALTSLWLLAGSASAVSLTLTQIGGTAQNGRGVVGDTIEVAVDFAFDENEAVSGVFPTLWWDQEGGNVLDLASAQEGQGGFLGQFRLAPINDRYILTDSPERGGRNDRFFEGGSNIVDDAIGTTFMWIGFEALIPIFTDELLIAEILTNGLPGPGSLRMGVATFEFADVGETTIGFFVDPSSTLRTVVSGARGVEFVGDDIQLTDIPVSAMGFSGLQIVVVPEPSTALLLVLGLFGLAARRGTTRRSAI